MAAKLLDKNETQMDAIMTEFAAKQDTVKKSNRYRHPEQSGIDAGAKCAEKPFLDLDWSWLEESAAILPAG